MQSEKVFSRHSLPNGLTLEFLDLSRPTAGDRCQVVVEARIAVPVNPAHLPPGLQDCLEEVRGALGSEVMFAKQEVRNFVAASEVADLIRRIEADLLASLRGYLNLPPALSAGNIKNFRSAKAGCNRCRKPKSLKR